jgi:hypothetical protein
MLCLPCLGSGEFPSGRRCPMCQGRGDLPDTRVGNPMCPFCIGTGRDPFHKGRLCSACDGWSRLPGPAEAARIADTQPPAPADPTARGPDPLQKLLQELAGDVDICHPSLDEDSLDHLRLLDRCDMIRVLTYDVQAAALPRVRDFVRELPRFLFRQYCGRELRDRYVLTTSEIVFVGPMNSGETADSAGLIRVPEAFAGEMIQEVRLVFNRLWSAGNTLA